MYLNYFFLWVDKKIRIGVSRKSGRNNQGTITVRHRLGMKKNLKIHIDFFRRLNIFGTLYKILENTPRTALLGSLIYDNGIFSIILLSEEVKLGSRIYSGVFRTNLRKGSTYLLKNLPLFTQISSIELFPRDGFSLSRSGGTSSLITVKGKKAGLKLKSGWNVFLSLNSLAVLGCSSNEAHKLKKLGKAGKAYALGIRPTVRGVAMNACDHPHGGGTGKKSPPRAQKSPWGWLTKNTPSMKKKAYLKKKKLYKDL